MIFAESSTPTCGNASRTEIFWHAAACARAKFLEGVLEGNRGRREDRCGDLLLGLRNIWTEISPRYRQDERTIKASQVTGGMQIDSNS